MTIRQRNLIFAHVPSMRPIGDFEANGEVERLDCDPPGYIDGEIRIAVGTHIAMRPYVPLSSQPTPAPAEAPPDRGSSQPTFANRFTPSEAPKSVPLFASIPDLGVGLPIKNPFVHPR